jgi:hypothetical protein
VITILSAIVSLLILMSQGDKLELQRAIGFEGDGSSHGFRRSSWAEALYVVFIEAHRLFDQLNHLLEEFRRCRGQNSLPPL